MQANRQQSRRPMVAGNWKMHGSTALATTLASSMAAAPISADLDVLVCPPFPYLPLVDQLLEGSSIRVGAQNVSEHEEGAYTGEVAASMLKEAGCRHVIVGHSERRSLFGETAGQVARKALAAARCGLAPIVCVGETLEERERGHTMEVVTSQLEPVMTLLQAECPEVLALWVVAYEPVWAIGTGKTATPAQAQEVHEALRAFIEEKTTKSTAFGTQLLYGGSVKPDNARSLFAEPDIDGGLIGGASLKPDDFLAICQAAADTMAQAGR